MSNITKHFIMIPTPITAPDGRHVKYFSNNWGRVASVMFENGYSYEAICQWLTHFGYDGEQVKDTLAADYGSVPEAYEFGKKDLNLTDWRFLQDWLRKYEGTEIEIPEDVMRAEHSEGGVQVAPAAISVISCGKEATTTGETVEFDIAGPGEEAKVPVVESPEDREAKSRALVTDPLPIFEQLNTYTLMVAQGLSNALLVTGMGGVGKSFNVNRILSAYGKKGRDYVVMKGKSSVSAMYKFLYDNYNKIVVFDDCDSVLMDDDGLNILKGVLDSTDVREVSWNTSGSKMVNTFGCETHEEIEAKLRKWRLENKGKEGIPNYFRFQGACIFISNLSAAYLQKKPAMAPLLTRCTTVDIQLTPEEVVTKIEAALPHMKIYNTRGDDITNEDIKAEVFDYVSSEEFLKDSRLEGKPLSFRCYMSAYKFRYAGLPNWKELSFSI